MIIAHTQIPHTIMKALLLVSALFLASCQVPHLGVVDSINDGWIRVETPNQSLIYISQDMAEHLREGDHVNADLTVDYEATLQQQRRMEALKAKLSGL